MLTPIYEPLSVSDGGSAKCDILGIFSKIRQKGNM